MSIYRRVKGRGTGSNPSSRFHKEQYETDFSDFGWVEEDDLPNIKTEYFTDHSRTILAKNDSPDIGFDTSINPYRGCEHGCSYCYARPTHEYLGLYAGFDFESKIFVKRQAPMLLRSELMKKKWRPQVIAMSGVTDCYQLGERKFELTRGCLSVLAEFKNPVVLITKNHLICRDADILSELARDNLVRVCLSVTSLDANLIKKLEPRSSAPMARLKAIEYLSKAGISVSVNVAPVIPGLTDQEIPSILRASAEAGAKSAGMTLVRLPYSVKDHFADWLERHFPERKNRVLHTIQGMRAGKLNNSEFGARMRGNGKRALQITETFKIFRRKYALNQKLPALRTDFDVQVTN